MRTYTLEGWVTQTVLVEVAAESLPEAVEKAQQGKYDALVSQYKPNYLDFHWYGDLDSVEVDLDGENTAFPETEEARSEAVQQWYEALQNVAVEFELQPKGTP